MLNVFKGEEALLEACRRCFASLLTDHAIAHRQLHGFAHYGCGPVHRCAADSAGGPRLSGGGVHA